MHYVIFDIDGTLTNTKKVDDKCFIKSFEQTFGIDISHEHWEEFTNVTDWGITEEIVIRELGREPTQQEYSNMRNNFFRLLQNERQNNPNQFSEINGAKCFFDFLSSKDGFEVGIATGSWKTAALIKLASIDISIDGICFSNSDHYKSRAEVTKHVIRQLGTKESSKPEKITYFGDGKWDLLTSHSIGIHFIGIDTEGDGKLTELGAETVFRDYSDQQLILDSLAMS